MAAGPPPHLAPTCLTTPLPQRPTPSYAATASPCTLAAARLTSAPPAPPQAPSSCATCSAAACARCGWSWSTRGRSWWARCWRATGAEGAEGGTGRGGAAASEQGERCVSFPCVTRRRTPQQRHTRLSAETRTTALCMYHVCRVQGRGAGPPRPRQPVALAGHAAGRQREGARRGCGVAAGGRDGGVGWSGERGRQGRGGEGCGGRPARRLSDGAQQGMGGAGCGKGLHLRWVVREWVCSVPLCAFARRRTKSGRERT
jgi:hypothetical protein